MKLVYNARDYCMSELLSYELSDNFTNTLNIIIAIYAPRALQR
jgi:hypothetical protein